MHSVLHHVSLTRPICYCVSSTQGDEYSLGDFVVRVGTVSTNKSRQRGCIVEVGSVHLLMAHIFGGDGGDGYGR